MVKNGVLTTEYREQYPVWSILVAMVLILASPFVSTMTSYAALAVCLYRVFRYDAKVFATDYALLAPLCNVFRTSAGLTLLIILCLVAAVVYLVREGLRADRSLVLILVLLNYLLLRMQTNISDFVLCFGQIFLLWVLLPKQNTQSAERTAKAFCIGLLATSLYALVLQDTWQLREVIGADTEALWGTGIMRFHGLYRDPNYYMTMLIVGLSMLIKLRENGRIKMLPFVLVVVSLVAFGVLTYSKTFFLALILLCVVYIIWQFRNKKVIWGAVLVTAIVVGAEFLLFSEDSPFAVVMSRLLGSEDLNDLTTGRSDVYLQYIEASTKSLTTVLFGYGFGAPELSNDPHNIYLEIIYRCGVVGIVLILIFLTSLASVLKLQEPMAARQGRIARYLSIGMVMVLYFTLHGIFMVEVYPNIFLAFLAILITPKQPEAS
ncbi:MAG: O-antigen ligase family protein [Ruminococcaceae bacterium]|nr:O-antigen ligase family protein [Oscillospiraceae bacterium]